MNRTSYAERMPRKPDVDSFTARLHGINLARIVQMVQAQRVRRSCFTRALARWALVVAMSATFGCSSSSSSAPPDELDPVGFPFVVKAGAATDVCGAPASSCAAGRNPPPGATIAILSQPEVGKVCLKGAVSLAGYAFVVLIFTEYDEGETKVLKTFDAEALGITQAAFTVDSPPSGGVTVIGAVVSQLDCAGSANGTACRTTGFGLMTAPLSQMMKTITEAGPQVAPFANFAQTVPGRSATFDTTALDSFAFFVGPGAYEFCLRDFKLLNAAGLEVTP